MEFHTNFEQKAKIIFTVWETTEDFFVNYQVISIILDIKSGTFTKIMFQYFTESYSRICPQHFQIHLKILCL